MLMLATPVAIAGVMLPAGVGDAVAPNASTATVVFLRPSPLGFATKIPIFDETGVYHGDAEAGRFFATTISSGPHTFVSQGENTPTLKAVLDAGKVYYIEVSITTGWSSPHGRLFGLGPTRKGWEDLPKTLAGCRLQVVDRTAADAYRMNHASEIDDALRRSDEVWAKYDTDARNERSLTNTDGVTEPVQPR